MAADAPSLSTCEPFTTKAAVRACDTAALAGVSDDDLDDAIQAASDYVYELLGRQFQGVCETTALPCPECGCGSLSGIVSWYGGGGWRDWSLSSCRCGSYPHIDLGQDPVVEVTSLRFEGDELDPTTYRVDDWRYVVRLDGEGWPSAWWAATEDGDESFIVQWRHGHEVPPLVERAVRAVALQLARECPGADCAIPPNTTSVSRQGVSLTLQDLVNSIGANASSGGTGIRELDRAIRAYNPLAWQVAAITITDPAESPTLRYPT